MKKNVYYVVHEYILVYISMHSIGEPHVNLMVLGFRMHVYVLLLYTRSFNVHYTCIITPTTIKLPIYFINMSLVQTIGKVLFYKY